MGLSIMERMAERVANKLLPPAHWGPGTAVRTSSLMGGIVKGIIVGPSYRLLASGFHLVRCENGYIATCPFANLELDE